MSQEARFRRQRIRDAMVFWANQCELMPSDLIVACVKLLQMATIGLTSKQCVPVNEFEHIEEYDVEMLECVHSIDDALKTLYYRLRDEEKECEF